MPEHWKPEHWKTLLRTAIAVIADHDERVLSYGEQENQPHRYLVMENLRKAIEETKDA